MRVPAPLASRPAHAYSAGQREFINRQGFVARLLLALVAVLAAALTIHMVQDALRRGERRVRDEVRDKGEVAMVGGSLRWVGIVVLITVIAVVSGQSIGAPADMMPERSIGAPVERP